MAIDAIAKFGRHLSVINSQPRILIVEKRGKRKHTVGQSNTTHHPQVMLEVFVQLLKCLSGKRSKSWYGRIESSE